jgi:predicted transcriptional regulator YdeE
LPGIASSSTAFHPGCCLLSDQPGGNAGIPSQWSRFAPHIGHITNEVPGVSYGVVYHVDPSNAFDYLCGVEVSALADVPSGCAVIRQRPRSR